MDVREKLVELHAAAPTAERRMIMTEYIFIEVIE